MSQPKAQMTPTLLFIGLMYGSLSAADCNENGVPDEQDLKPTPRFSSTSILPLRDWPAHVASADFDGDGLQDLVGALANFAGLSIKRNLGDGAFAPASVVVVQRIPSFVLPVDLDADGSPDLTATHPRGDTLAVTRNNGDGTFPPPELLSVGHQPGFIVAGDFSGDGKMDLVVAGPADRTLLLGKGTATFEKAVSLQGGGDIGRLAVADFDGDGDLDLADGSRATKSIAIRTNDGLGSFSDSRRVPLSGEPRDLDAADLDGNGLSDLVVSAFEDGLLVLKNFGADPFERQVAIQAATSPELSRVADLDGDDDPDIYSRSHLGLVVLWNPGPGDFVSGPSSKIADWGNPMATGDFDGDADLDIAAGGIAGIIVFWNAGERKFLSPTFMSAGEGAVRVITADLNGDGNLDIATSNQDSRSVSIQWNKSGRSFSRWATDYETAGSPVAIICADLNGDGKPDLCVAGGDAMRGVSGVSVHLNRGDGTLLPAKAQTIFSGRIASDVVAADFDRDGDLDLAASSGSLSDLWILWNQGDGSFPAKTVLPLTWGPSRLAAADFDGDGDVDLTTYTFQTSSVELHWNDGAGHFSEGQRPDSLGGVKSFTTADLDDDGDLDSIAASNSSSVSFLENVHGTFTAIDQSLNTYPATAIMATDLDADGRQDLIIGQDTTKPLGAIGIYWSQEPWHYSSTTQLPARRGVQSMAALDMNRDGKLDLIAANVGSNDLSVFYNSGNRDLSRAVHRVTGLDPFSLASCDLDGNGLADLAIANLGSRTISVLLNPTEDVPDGPLVLPFDQEVIPFAAADLDGDSDIDLAVPSGSIVSVRANHGRGSFKTVASVATDTNFRDFIVADLDGDDRPELVGADFTNSELWLRWSSTDGTYSGPTDHVSLGLPVVSVTSGDLDADGDLDLAAAGYTTGEVRIIWNQGSRQLSPGEKFLAGSRTVQAFDLNGDGLTDLAVTDGSDDQIILLKNLGKGTFEKIVVELPSLEGFFPPTSSPRLCIGDLDRDGDLDLSIYDTGVVATLRNEGSFTFVLGEIFSSWGARDASAADMDGDGNVDLATAVYLNQAAVIWNDPRTFSEDVDKNGIPDDCEGARFRRGDANADGRFDITDSIFLLRSLFQDGTDLPCRDAGDTDGSGELQITDAVYGLRFQFLDGPPPKSPFPICGIDHAMDDLDCLSYPGCQ